MRLSHAGKWRDTLCKKDVRHCVTCEVPDPQQVFTLRGLCEESQIDRGYFLVNGRQSDANATLMNPAYEGFFSQLRFVSQAEEGAGEESAESERFMIPTGRWEISSRLPGAKYSYRCGSTGFYPTIHPNSVLFILE